MTAPICPVLLDRPSCLGSACAWWDPMPSGAPETHGRCGIAKGQHFVDPAVPAPSKESFTIRLQAESIREPVDRAPAFTTRKGPDVEPAEKPMLVEWDRLGDDWVIDDSTGYYIACVDKDGWRFNFRAGAEASGPERGLLGRHKAREALHALGYQDAPGSEWRGHEAHDMRDLDDGDKLRLLDGSTETIEHATPDRVLTGDWRVFSTAYLLPLVDSIEFSHDIPF